MNTNNLLIQIDRLSSYVPVLSTVTNLIDIIQKTVVVPNLSQETIGNSNYLSYLQEKDIWDCLLLLLPIVGNINALYEKLLWNDKDFVLKNVIDNPSSIQRASDKLQNDSAFLLHLYAHHKDVFKYLNNTIKNDDEFFLKVIQIDLAQREQMCKDLAPASPAPQEEDIFYDCSDTTPLPQNTL